MSVTVENNFPIEDDFVSIRIFFAKENEHSRVWHICDAALGTVKHQNADILFIALHGHPIRAVIKADTVLDCKIKSGASDQFCMNCLDEYELAKDIIQERKLLKFR